MDLQDSFQAQAFSSLAILRDTPVCSSVGM